MKLSKQGLQKIIQREGNILHAYQDTVGVWTIGVGHTSAAGAPKVVPGMTITKAQSEQILMLDMIPIEKQLNDTIKVPVTQNQYDALVSIVFNCGPKFLKSTAMKRLNAGDYKGAAEAIMMWNKPPEIIGRRSTEKKQFLTPDTKQPVIKPEEGALAGTVTAGGGFALAFKDYGPEILIGSILLGVAIYTIVRVIRERKKNV